MVFRKSIILIGVVFFMTLFIFTAIMLLKNEVEVLSEEGVTLTLEKPSFIVLSEPGTSENGSDVTHVYDMELFGLDVGTYTLVNRSLENGTSLIFEEVDNTGWIPYTLEMKITNLEGADFKSWNPSPVTRLEEEQYGVDPTTNPHGVFTTAVGEILVGHVFVSRDLTLESGEEVQELRHQIADFETEEGELSKNLWLPPKHSSQTWLMAAPGPLFETKEAEDEWIEFSLDNRLSQLNWLTPDGPYVKLERTDDLRTEFSFGHSETPAAYQVFGEWNETAPSLFFESMLLNAEINQQ